MPPLGSRWPRRNRTMKAVISDFEPPLQTSGSRRRCMLIDVWDFRLIMSNADFTTSVVCFANFENLFHHFNEVKHVDNSLLLILSHFRKIVDGVSSPLVSVFSC